MTKLQKIRIGSFVMYLLSDTVNPSQFLDKFLRTGNQANKGRGGLKLISINDELFVCRKYLHGGVGRAVTKDLFLSEKRALNEIQIMIYLKENHFPVVEQIFPLENPTS